MKVKEEFSETYKSDHARWGQPHITLVNLFAVRNDGRTD